MNTPIGVSSFDGVPVLVLGSVVARDEGTTEVSVKDRQRVRGNVFGDGNLGSRRRARLDSSMRSALLALAVDLLDLRTVECLLITTRSSDANAKSRSAACLGPK